MKTMLFIVLASACSLRSSSNSLTGMTPLDAAIDSPDAAASAFAFVPASIEFDYVPTGTVSAPVAVDVVNQTGADIPGFALSLTGDDTLEINITQTTCTSTLPATGCHMLLFFAPLSDGDHLMELTASAPGQAPVSAPIHAIGGLRPTPFGTTVSFLDYGFVAVGSSSSKTVTYKNSGATTLPPIAFTFAGESPGEYHVANDSCTGLQLPSQGTCTVDVVYAPTSVLVAGDAILYAAAFNTSELDLRASPTAATMLSISPTSHDFGNVGPGPSPSVPFTVTNVGSVTATGIAATFYNSQFVVASSTCASPVAPGASCTISVQLHPTATGPDGGGMQVIGTNTSPVTAGFMAIGVPAQGVILDSWSQDFGTATVGETGNSHTFTVTNVGTMATTVALSLEESFSQFTIANDNCSAAPLAASGTCTFQIMFTPTSAGSVFAQLHATSQFNDAIAKLTAIASAPEPPLNINPLVYDYGTLAIGQIPSNGFLISNPGQQTKVPTISLAGPNASEFVVKNDACTGVALGPSASCIVDVWYKPATVGTKTANLVATWSTGSSTATLNAGAFESTDPFVTSDPPSLDFGNVLVGHNADITLPFTNHGAASSPPMSMQFYGPDNGDFSLVQDHCKGKVLANGDTCLVTVRFTPSSTGVKNASLQVTINYGSDTALTGTGQ